MYSKVKADLTKKSIAVDTLFSVHAQMLHACLYTMLLTHTYRQLVVVQTRLSGQTMLTVGETKREKKIK
jgi:hypothetical protein